MKQIPVELFLRFMAGDPSAQKVLEDLLGENGVPFRPLFEIYEQYNNDHLNNHTLMARNLDREEAERIFRVRVATTSNRMSLPVRPAGTAMRTKIHLVLTGFIINTVEIKRGEEIRERMAQLCGGDDGFDVRLGGRVQDPDDEGKRVETDGGDSSPL